MDDAFLDQVPASPQVRYEAAFKNIKKYFKVRKDHPEMFKDLTPSRVPFDAMCRKNRITTVSRHKDPMGRAVALMKTRLFGYDLKELHQLVPDDVIPEENGGTNESYDYEPLQRELESEEGFYQNLGSYGYRDAPTKTEP
ncbi:hypothetical protein HPB52_012618 [Rhipicephalus sanguineus]|uniref:Uncharacterized protein n=1 Tax=Rhipicephalus sanguineus TaxID=34632 RepID=A0A9D4T3M0_RHISA|nr:hypothetical protein HPB52_012618 [Rhipicephalus sanguineus]